MRPLASEEQFEETMRCVRELAKEGGDGHALQALLEARATEQDNWMADWWLEIAYLGYRDPVIVWSSPGIVWPNQEFSDTQQQIRCTNCFQQMKTPVDLFRLRQSAVPPILVRWCKGRCQKKRVFLGLCPKLWVGGGQTFE